MPEVPTIPGLKIEFSPDGIVAVFTIKDHIPPDRIPEVEEFFMAAFESGCRRLLVDMSEAASMSDTGAGLIVYYVKMLRAKGGGLAVVRPRGISMEQLAPINLETSVGFYDTREEALAALDSAEAKL